MSWVWIYCSPHRDMLLMPHTYRNIAFGAYAYQTCQSLAAIKVEVCVSAIKMHMLSDMITSCNMVETNKNTHAFILMLVIVNCASNLNYSLILIKSIFCSNASDQTVGLRILLGAQSRGARCLGLLFVWIHFYFELTPFPIKGQHIYYGRTII